VVHPLWINMLLLRNRYGDGSHLSCIEQFSNFVSSSHSGASP
jgi:hypothetical protein